MNRPRGTCRQRKVENLDDQPKPKRLSGRLRKVKRKVIRPQDVPEITQPVGRPRKNEKLKFVKPTKIAIRKEIDKVRDKSFGKSKGFKNFSNWRSSSVTLYSCSLCQRVCRDRFIFRRHQSQCINAYMNRVCKTCNLIFRNFSSYNTHVCHGIKRKHPETGCLKVCMTCWKKFHSVQLACLHVPTCDSKNGRAEEWEKSDAKVDSKQALGIEEEVEEVESAEKEPIIKLGNIVSSSVDVMVKSASRGGGGDIRGGGVIQNGGGHVSVIHTDKINNPDYRVHWLLRDPKFPNPLGIPI